MKARIHTIILVVAALVLAACQAPSVPNSGSKAALTIHIGNDINSRTLAPSIDMNASSYTVTGSGPGGATFTATTSGGTVTQNSLAFGSWTVVVNATNSVGNLIGTGSATAQVNTASTSSVSVTVTPVSGVGTLNLGVSWPNNSVQTPSIAAALTPALGSAQNLPFNITGSSASYTSSSVGNGYYTLALTVKDSGVIVAGAVDVVRIVTGQTTSGSYAFSSVNAPGGAIQVNVNANMQNPLDVAIAGASTTQSVGTSQTLTASVSNYSGNVVYVWYVNGVSAATGSTFDFNAGSVVGYSYRVDVTAFSADGTRAGSATTSVGAVVPSGPPVGVVLILNSNNTQINTNIAWNGSQYGVVWSDRTSGSYDVYFSRLDRQGHRVGTIARVSTSTGNEYNAQVVWNGSVWGILWEEFTTPNNYNTYFSTVSADGTSILSVSNVTQEYESGGFDVSEIVWTGNEFAFCWRVYPANSPVEAMMLSRYSALGVRAFPDVVAVDSSSSGYHPALAWNGTSYGLTWIGQGNWLGNINDAIYYKQLAADGTGLTGAVRLTTSPGSAVGPSLAWAGDRYVIAWADSRGGQLNAYCDLIQPNGVKLVPEFSISNGTLQETSPTVAWTGSEALVTFGNWGKLTSSAVDIQGNIVFKDHNMGDDGSFPAEPKSVWDGSGIATVWYDSGMGRFCRMDANGKMY